ncbi:MAG: DNA-3-methyladenine glycosylase [Acidimicrobiales bacterium]|nr:DNA-3-methyladenine glycosylase [Acidimicrobiales bacterium]
MRCFGDGDPIYERYHDEEWGVAVRDERGLYERISLEAFQSGLSWITILRKREGFRAAFAGFDPEVVAEYGPADVERLLGDAAIVRNRAKIGATIANARAVLDLRDAGTSLPDLLWSFAPTTPNAPAERLHDVPSTTPESKALAKALKARGFRFVGPTTAYAAMQACGLVDDHLATCQVRRL